MYLLKLVVLVQLFRLAVLKVKKNHVSLHLKKGQSLETISLEEALDLFKLPRSLGNYEEEEMIVSIGRFGALHPS